MSRSRATAVKTPSRKPRAPKAPAPAAPSPVVDLSRKRAEKKGRARGSKIERTKREPTPEQKDEIIRRADEPVPAETAPPAPPPEKPAEQQVLGPPFKLLILASDLKPFLTIAPTKEQRHYLNGVHVHKVGNELRLVATDGHRLLVQSIEHNDPLPWAEGDGVILPSERLARIAKYLGTGNEPVELVYGANWKSLTLGCASATFDVTLIDGKYPDYVRVLADVGDVFSAEREPLETSAINPKYLKQAGQIGALYEAEGVFCFTGKGEGAMAFTFAGVKGVILVQMGMRADKPTLEGSVAKLIGERGMTGTLAALKAHETRNRTAAKKAKDEAERGRLAAAADRFAARIAEIMAGLAPQLEHKPQDEAPAAGAN
jgi:DNA polymerase III beta subunit, central domain